MIDIIMLEMDRLTLCKNIRPISDVPMLIISAKSEDGYKVKGLNIGADISNIFFNLIPSINEFV